MARSHAASPKPCGSALYFCSRCGNPAQNRSICHARRHHPRSPTHVPRASDVPPLPRNTRDQLHPGLLTALKTRPTLTQRQCSLRFLQPYSATRAAVAILRETTSPAIPDGSIPIHEPEIHGPDGGPRRHARTSPPPRAISPRSGHSPRPGPASRPNIRCPHPAQLPRSYPGPALGAIRGHDSVAWSPRTS